VGYGPLEATLKQRAASLRNVVFHPKFSDMETGLQHYLHADILVMPSTMRYGRSDVWGFVINEALACGCYVMAGETVGAVPELINQAPLDVGLAFNPDNTSEFVASLHAASRAAKTRDRAAIMQWGQSIDGSKLGDAFLRAMASAGVV
jgi:glycosyltransferase involved in cell wall biosynthesis